MPKKPSYRGYTYHVPSFKPILDLWRWLFCKRGWHLWDEVSTWTGDSSEDWYLVCDACEERIGLHEVKDEKNADS